MESIKNKDRVQTSVPKRGRPTWLYQGGLFVIVGSVLVMHMTYLSLQDQEQEYLEIASGSRNSHSGLVDPSFFHVKNSTSRVATMDISRKSKSLGHIDDPKEEKNQESMVPINDKITEWNAGSKENTIVTPTSNVNTTTTTTATTATTAATTTTTRETPIRPSQNMNTNTRNDGDKSRIVSILEASGIHVTEEILHQLPTWSAIESVYGSKPVIFGLDTCTTFQTTIPTKEAYIGPAGIFNTGTNLLADVLLKYCEIPDNAKRSMLWQVPWGKHNPISWRHHNIAVAGGEEVKNQTTVLPVVTIKDPYGWMGSMCRHPYAAHWRYSHEHCPNLVLDEVDASHHIKGDPKTGRVTVSVAFKKENATNHDTLVGLWNDWYGDYMAIHEFPRLIVRYEDLMFHTEEVVRQVCHCGGGRITTENNITLVANSAKGSTGAHEGANGLLSAILRYGNPVKRIEGMTPKDLEFAETSLRKDLMETFRYSYHHANR